MQHKVLHFLLLLSLAYPAFPQSGPDTAFVSAAIHNTRNVYRTAIGTQARIFNGSKYLAPDYSDDYHPFFLSDDWLTGDVFYDGEYFQDIALMYDLSSGQLITEHLSSGQSIQLVWDKLEHFTISDQYFEKIDPASAGGTLPQTDFYNVLYAGTIKLVARRQKFLREKIVSTTVERSFEEKYRYFLYKNGVYFPVKNKGSIMKLMSDKKQEMKRFFKQQALPFAQNRETLLTRLAKHYDSLK